MRAAGMVRPRQPGRRRPLRFHGVLPRKMMTPDVFMPASLFSLMAWRWRFIYAADDAICATVTSAYDCAAATPVMLREHKALPSTPDADASSARGLLAAAADISSRQAHFDASRQPSRRLCSREKSHHLI